MILNCCLQARFCSCLNQVQVTTSQTSFVCHARNEAPWFVLVLLRACLAARTPRLTASRAAPDITLIVADVYVLFRDHVELLQRVRVLWVCHIAQVLHECPGKSFSDSKFAHYIYNVYRLLAGTLCPR